MTPNADSVAVDERAIALVVDWWTTGPVSDSELDAAVIDDVRSLFAHLHANGYGIVRLAQIDWSGAS